MGDFIALAWSVDTLTYIILTALFHNGPTFAYFGHLLFLLGLLFFSVFTRTLKKKLIPDLDLVVGAVAAMVLYFPLSAALALIGVNRHDVGHFEPWHFGALISYPFAIIIFLIICAIINIPIRVLNLPDDD